LQCNISSSFIHFVSADKETQCEHFYLFKAIFGRWCPDQPPNFDPYQCAKERNGLGALNGNPWSKKTRGNAMPHKFLGIVLATFAVLAFAAVSEARDNGQYAHVAKNIRDWIESLTDTNGIGCCATADGLRPQAIDWNMAANHYRVKVRGRWIGVPNSAVIKEPNRLGYTVAWLEYDWDIDTGEQTIRVRCFMPGAAS
jgi:hypothetical protein